jgi:hypothetical protein
LMFKAGGSPGFDQFPNEVFHNLLPMAGTL